MPSTAIRSLSYDEVTSTLFVTFVDGDLYAYFEVPAKVADAFRRARSKGGFFARRVRPHYRYQKLGEGGPPLPSSRPERSAEPGPSHDSGGRPLVPDSRSRGFRDDADGVSPGGPASPPRAGAGR